LPGTLTQTARNGLSPRWHRLGIRTRLMAMHITVMTIVIGAIVWQSDHLFVARLNREFNRDLTEEGPEFSDASANRPRGEPLSSFARFYLDTHQRLARHALIIGLDGPAGSRAPEILFSPHAGGIAANPLVSSLITHTALPSDITSLTIGSSHYRVLATPITESGHRVGTLVAVRNLAGLEAERRSELTVALLAGFAALIAAVAAGYLLLRRVLRVVSDVTSTAEHAAGGDLSLRVHYAGPPDELGRLAQTVDTMLGRLDQAFSAQRRLLSDVSHQLRTPLTVIRGHLEVLAREPASDTNEQAETIAIVVDELEHISLMVERLLMLGRALEPDFIEEEEIDVVSLLEDVMDAVQHLAPREWVLELGPPLVILGDRTKLRGALLNLIDNAVGATSAADTIAVGARRDERGDLILEVTDTGRGISLADQQRLFERFSRSTERYRGSGLGLAIVRAVAEAHGGHVEMEGAPREGCRVRIILPGDRILRERERAVVG
jgi:signal transduction histidine kinase